MDDAGLIDRLAALPELSGIPREELEWLTRQGRLEVYDEGTIVAPEGHPIRQLWIVLAGHIAIRVDRGAGPRRVMEWRTGDVTGMLPYSRMTGSPGNNQVEEKAELLAIPEELFPEMTHLCPAFTAHTVHLMLDRARSFNTSDLHDEKMVSLGKLAAGLAHELNNPASAMLRNAKLLVEGLDEVDAASRALGLSGMTDRAFAAVEQIRAERLAARSDESLSPIERADREDAIDEWLERHELDRTHAVPLTDLGITTGELDRLAAESSGATLEAALRWIAAGCETRVLADSMERAAGRIYELVTAVKGFTYMDDLAGPALVEVGPGLQDTVRMVDSRAESSGALVSLEVEDDLPPVRANAGELNQVWLNLIDNALDAVSEGGRIGISAAAELDRVVVRVVDDGPGIAPEILPQIFDPFFTTKPPGQGTGLGLDITRRLVRQHQGDITVHSQPGRTEFRVSLVAEGEAAEDEGG